jgi:glycosyltransferase involved in cell wall biosynthesis
VDLDHFELTERIPLAPESGVVLPSAPEVPVLAFLARSPELKGLPALTRALGTLLDLPWHLVVAGPKSFRSVEADLSRIGQSITNTGPNRQSDRWTYVPNIDSAALLAASSLVVQPTWRDPCSLTTLEALATGRRVLTTLDNGASTHVLAGVAAPEQGAFATSDCGSVIASTSDEGALGQALLEELTRAQNWSLKDARRVREQAALVPAEVSFQRMEALVRELAGG